MTQSEIILKYPKIFGTPPFDPKETLIAFGFGVPKYWIPVLEKGFEKINEIAPENFKVVQVKEKFGLLTIYTKNGNEETEKIIKEMGKECSEICMECGKPGSFRRIGGWFYVLCDGCAKKKNFQ